MDLKTRVKTKTSLTLIRCQFSLRWELLNCGYRDQCLILICNWHHLKGFVCWKQIANQKTGNCVYNQWANRETVVTKNQEIKQILRRIKSAQHWYWDEVNMSVYHKSPQLWTLFYAKMRAVVTAALNIIYIFITHLQELYWKHLYILYPLDFCQHSLYFGIFPGRGGVFKSSLKKKDQNFTNQSNNRFIFNF